MAPFAATTAVLLTFILWSSVHSQTNICYEKADILFIMDASGSVGAADFQKQLQFAAMFVSSFDVSQSQFSVLRFDSDVALVIEFDDYRDSTALKNAILNIKYTEGGTDTASALKLAREQAFTSSRGSRAGVPKIAIVSTDGQSFNPNDTAIEAQNLKNAGVLILTIGIGPLINKVELETIATYAADVFEFGDYNQLVSVVYDYSAMVCLEVPLFKCSGQADIFFLLDASNGISQVSFKNELLFANNISAKLDLTDAHIGAATFGGSTVQKIFSLGQFADQASLSQVLLGAQYIGDSTDTDIALSSITSLNVFDTTSGGRPDAAKIVIILTDGGSVSQAQAVLTARRLRLTGVNIIAVGVSKPNIAELQSLVAHTVLDIVANLANPKVALERIQTLTAIQECAVPTRPIRDISDYCNEFKLANGIHPDPYDCTRFIECTYLRTSVMNCSTPLVHMVFNPDPAVLTCEYPGHVKPNPCNPFNSHVTVPPVTVTSPATTQKPCIKGLLDILFILDASGNVTSSDFSEELRDATNVAENFIFGSSSIQFAAITFATSSNHLFNFDDFSDYKPLEEAILSAGYDGGISSTYLALEDALSFISSGPGSRPSAPKLAILFSSGRSTDSQRTLQAAAALKNAGVHVLAVGYSNPDMDQLRAIASSSGEAFFNNFNGLLNAVTSYSNTTCITDVTVCKGIQFSDVIFIVDSSASIAADDYMGLLSFVINVISKFTIGLYDMRFGALIFSNDIKKLFDLGDFDTHAKLSSALLIAPHLNGGTETAKAINFVREQQMFSNAHGGRDNATKIIIILTDGRSNSINDTVTAAQRLKATGVKFIAVGIGDEVYDVEIKELASDDKSAFLVPNFAALEKLNDTVTRQVCVGSKPNGVDSSSSTLCSDRSWADGIHPNPKDCSTYVDCDNFVTTLYNCKIGENFDPIQERCVDKSIAHPCDDSNYFGATVTLPPSFVVTTIAHVTIDITNLCADHNLADGNYPDPNNCARFIECTAKGTTGQPCPEGLNFNTGNGVCDDFHVVDCNVNSHYYDHS